jgi:hypothetical protein
MTPEAPTYRFRVIPLERIVYGKLQVQAVADGFGSVVSLLERVCSGIATTALHN